MGLRQFFRRFFGKDESADLMKKAEVAEVARLYEGASPRPAEFKFPSRKRVTAGKHIAKRKAARSKKQR